MTLDSQMSQWYHQPTPQYQSHYQNLQWNNQPLHQSQQGEDIDLTLTVVIKTLY